MNAPNVTHIVIYRLLSFGGFTVFAGSPQLDAPTSRDGVQAVEFFEHCSSVIDF